MKTIVDNIFYASFFVQIGGDINKALKAYCNKIGEPVVRLDPGSRRLGHFFGYENYKNGVIWIRDKKDLKTIAHECLHATYHIMNHMEVPMNEHTEEIWAYYQAYLVGEVLR